MIDKTILRIKKGFKNPYLMVLRSVAQDDRLSLKARGLMLYLLSLPDDWQIYQREIAKHFPDGEHAIRSAFKQLKDFGYIISYRLRDDRGVYCGYQYQIYEAPQPINMHIGELESQTDFNEQYHNQATRDLEKVGLTNTNPKMNS